MHFDFMIFMNLPFILTQRIPLFHCTDSESQSLQNGCNADKK
jgi:hypothetical protein